MVQVYETCGVLHGIVGSEHGDVMLFLLIGKAAM